MTWSLIHADCRDVMANMGDETIDSVVCDPPYHLTSIVKRFGPGQAAAQYGTDGLYARASRGFMGQTWDGGDIAFDPALWAEVLRVLKPGGHLVAFSGTRTYHRMACAIEDAGFEIRDMLEWLYGSGFPKGGIDDAGRGPALKPAHEPICLARKAFKGSAAACVATHGTGLLNIDDCRVDASGENRESVIRGGFSNSYDASKSDWGKGDAYVPSELGRFPANVMHDGLTEAWSKYFYCAKASTSDRNEGLPEGTNIHPTVKPTDVMRWLVRLATPPGGLVFDPFTGSGSTGKAAVLEGRRFIGAEMTAEYVPIARARIAHAALTRGSN